MNKNTLLSVANKIVETINVPEWGEVKLRRLSFAEIDKFNSFQSSPVDGFAWLVICAVCDEDGKKIFSEEDAEQIKSLPAEIVYPIGQAVAARIGVTFDKLEESKKN